MNPSFPSRPEHLQPPGSAELAIPRAPSVIMPGNVQGRPYALGPEVAIRPPTQRVGMSAVRAAAEDGGFVPTSGTESSSDVPVSRAESESAVAPAAGQGSDSTMAVRVSASADTSPGDAPKRPVKPNPPAGEALPQSDQALPAWLRGGSAKPQPVRDPQLDALLGRGREPAVNVTSSIDMRPDAPQPEESFSGPEMVLDVYIRKARQILDGPYSYRHRTRPPESRDKAIVLPALIAAFYGIARQDDLTNIHTEIMQTAIDQRRVEHLTGNRESTDARTMMQGIHRMIRIVTDIGRSQAGFYLDRDLFTKQRIAADMAIINARPQPPEVTDLARQFVPRFAWQPHQLPEGVKIDQDTWSGVTKAETAHLATDAEIEAGGVPYHVAMRVADALKAEGRSDDAYLIKTTVVGDTIRRETIAAEPDERGTSEIPYYTMIFPPAAAGIIDVPLPRDVACNYVRTIRDVVAETWDRFVTETQSGQPGVATKFLNDILDSDEVMPAGLAISMVLRAYEGDVNLSEAIQAVHQRAPRLTASLELFLNDFSKAFIIDNQSVARLADRVTPQGESAIVSPEALNTSAVRLAGDDVHSFEASLEYLSNGSVRGSVQVGIDGGVGRVDATVTLQEDDDTRKLQIAIGLADGAVVVQTADEQPLDEAVIDKVRSLIGRAIKAEDQKVAEAAKAKQARAEQVSSTSTVKPTSPQQLRRGPRSKTRGRPASPPVAQPTLVEVGPAETTRSERLVGFDEESVTAMLGAKNIKGVDAVSLTRRVRDKLNAVNETIAGGAHASLGKRLILLGVRGGDALKIRQVNVIMRGGRQMRALFTEQPGGLLEFVGLYDKKGHAGQIEDLRRLVRRVRGS